MNEEITKFFSEKAKKYWANIDIVTKSERGKKMRMSGNKNRWYKMTKEERSILAKKIRSYGKQKSNKKT